MRNRTPREVLEDYRRSIKETERRGEELCRVLEDILRPVIPDIEAHVGSIEAGIETIELDSRKLGNRSYEVEMNCRPLHFIIEEAVPELGEVIESFIWVTKGEAKKVKEILLEIFGEG